MRHPFAPSLLAACAASKLLLLGTALLDPSTLAAALWQDLVLVAGVAVLERAGRRLGKLLWILHLALGGYIALNTAVARVLSTPLTVNLLGAAGGTLQDSIRTYVTGPNLACIGGVLAISIAGPFVARRLAAPRWLRGAVAAVAMGLILTGPSAAARSAGGGLLRNAVFALPASVLARHRVPHASVLPPLPVEGAAVDATDLAGVARGSDVLLVVLESTGARHLAAWGAPRDPTPRLTALAADALIVEHAYTAYPESIKGLFATLASRAPAPNTAAEQYSAGRFGCASVADQFAAAGYRTGLFHSGHFAYLGMQSLIGGRGFDVLADASSIPSPHASSFGIDDGSTAQRTLALVDSLRPEERFFAVFMPIAGHHPYRAPGAVDGPFVERDDADRYHNDLWRSDAALASLLEGLAKRGRLERTLIAVVGDHGEAFYEHAGNFAHSMHVYEENVRVPMLFKAPGMRGQRRLPQLAGLADLPPTLAALAGVPAPSCWEGRSLLEPVPGHAAFFADHGVLELGLRHGPYKVVREPDSDRTRLFDLRSDPKEQMDLAADLPERTRTYAAWLDAWAQTARASVVNGAL